MNHGNTVARYSGCDDLHSHHRKIGGTPGNTGEGVSLSRRIRTQIEKEQAFADGPLCDLPGSKD